MPRTGRGGSRSGTPGKAYGNRSDLNGSKPAIAAYKGQAYGERKAQVDAQRAVPVGPPPTDTVPGATGAPAAAAPLGPNPGALGSLTDPTARPDEPLTAGLASGPGAGPGVVPQVVSQDPDVAALLAIYRAHPSASLRQIIETAQQA